MSWHDDDRVKVTGYQWLGHWCNSAYANLFAEWKSYKPLGFDMQLATTPRGDVMCKSIDGTTCLPADAPASSAPIEPLVCGKIYKRRIGGSSTGYDDPKHWCSSPDFTVAVVRRLTINKGEYMAYRYGGPANSQFAVSLPNWTADESPIWLFRIKRPASIAPSTMRIVLPGPHRESSTHATIIYLNNATNSGSFFNSQAPKNDEGKYSYSFDIGHRSKPFVPYFGNQTNNQTADFDVQWGADREFTVGYKVTPEGKVLYFQGPGWDSTRYNDIEWREGVPTGHSEGLPWLEGSSYISIHSENWHSFENQHHYRVHEALFEFSEAMLIKQRRIPR